MHDTSISKKTVYISRRARFNAAHKLYNPDWSDEKNHEVFGKCANANWHGHNYELHVTVKGVPNDDTGYCMDMKTLSDLIKEFVEEPLDHKNLNLDVPWMKGKRASTENLIIEIWNQLEKPIQEYNCSLHKIRLYETENNYADYFGGE
jgi:6-pyruvoyltetrahydropterin/6-carboxytetrahydropterin synthase